MMIIRVSRLCFLATQANDEPHISLMTFSYYTTPVEDVIVFTMRRDTKKYQQIVNNHKVNEYIPYNMRCGQGRWWWWWMMMMDDNDDRTPWLFPCPSTIESIKLAWVLRMIMMICWYHVYIVVYFMTHLLRNVIMIIFYTIGGSIDSWLPSSRYRWWSG